MTQVMKLALREDVTKHRKLAIQHIWQDAEHISDSE